MDTDALHVGVLGAFEVRIDGRPVGPAGGRRRGLLAILTLEANSVVSVATLIDRMWGDLPPLSATNLIQTYVSTWRKALGHQESPAGRGLATVGAGYRLHLATQQSDLLTFREQTARGRVAADARAYAEARAAYAAALAAWRGPPLVDLAAQPWHDRLVSRLNDERLAAMEGWARASLLSGADPRIVAADLARVRADEPLREELTELLMWALTVSGRQAEALEAFSETRLLLRDGLGADPGPALAAMHARVLNADASLHPRSVMEAKPPSTNAADRRHQVSPAPSDSLVGRDATIAAVTPC
jgi:DNA-binding SARP family transcriptional activator